MKTAFNLCELVIQKQNFAFLILFVWDYIVRITCWKLTAVYYKYSVLYFINFQSIQRS